MSYFAKVENGVVLDIIKADQSFVDSLDGVWIEYFKDANGEAEKKYNPAKVNNSIYDYTNKAFINKQPFPSWVLNSKYQWEAPVIKPENTETHFYFWSEENKNWVMVERE